MQRNRRTGNLPSCAMNLNSRLVLSTWYWEQTKLANDRLSTRPRSYPNYVSPTFNTLGIVIIERVILKPTFFFLHMSKGEVEKRGESAPEHGQRVIRPIPSKRQLQNGGRQETHRTVAKANPKTFFHVFPHKYHPRTIFFTQLIPRRDMNTMRWKLYHKTYFWRETKLTNKNRQLDRTNSLVLRWQWTLFWESKNSRGSLVPTPYELNWEE